MPIDRVIDRARRRLTVRAEGHITFEDIREHVQTRVNEGTIGYGQVFDARGATLDLTADQKDAGMRVQIFNDIDEAERWLDAPPCRDDLS
jgi:hypothetical protein